MVAGAVMFGAAFIFGLFFEASWQAGYFGPERWRRWAWLKSHGFKKAAWREKVRIYAEDGMDEGFIPKEKDE